MSCISALSFLPERGPPVDANGARWLFSSVPTSRAIYAGMVAQAAARRLTHRWPPSWPWGFHDPYDRRTTDGWHGYVSIGETVRLATLPEDVIDSGGRPRPP